MKRVHVVSAGDSYMYRLAIALKNKGYDVSCSGVKYDSPEAQELLQSDVLLEELSYFTVSSRPRIDYVVPSLQVTAEHPEIKKAREQGLLVVAFPDFILRMAKDKIRVVISDVRYPTRILSMIYRAVVPQNMRCDYVVMNEMKGLEKRIVLS